MIDSSDEEEAEEEGEGEGEMAEGEIEKGIYTVKRLLVKEERADGTHYLVDWEGWSLDEASWEPLDNILTANKEVREFEEVLAAMPKLDAFNMRPGSACCFGKLCSHPRLDADGTGPSLVKCTSCGDAHHHLCAAENVWLKWIGDDEIEGRKCFDCWLLEAQLRNTVHQLQVKPQP